MRVFINQCDLLTLHYQPQPQSARASRRVVGPERFGALLQHERGNDFGRRAENAYVHADAEAAMPLFEWPREHNEI
jgi:hypothetical protein